MIQNKNLKSLDQFISEEIGLQGTSKRNEFEKGFEEFSVRNFKNQTI